MSDMKMDEASERHLAEVWHHTKPESKEIVRAEVPGTGRHLDWLEREYFPPTPTDWAAVKAVQKAWNDLPQDRQDIVQAVSPVLSAALDYAITRHVA